MIHCSKQSSFISLSVGSAHQVIISHHLWQCVRLYSLICNQCSSDTVQLLLNPTKWKHTLFFLPDISIYCLTTKFFGDVFFSSGIKLCLIFTSTDVGSNIKEAFNLLLNDIPGQPARWCRWRGLSAFCQRKTSTRSAPRWWWWSRRQMAARITSDWPSCQSFPPSSHQTARPTLLPPSLWTETDNRSSAINADVLFELYVAFDQLYCFKRTTTGF